MSKVRRIDWSPDEWIAGTAGLLTYIEAAVYMAALMAIYSRGGECPNDAAFLAARFKRGGAPTRPQSVAAHIVATRAALDQLVALGKLKLSADGQWLSNGRADLELGKADGRIEGARRAGKASGVARADRRANRRPAVGPAVGQLQASRSAGEPVSSNPNDLARTRVRNHQPSTINSKNQSRPEARTVLVAAREAASSDASARATGRASLIRDDWSPSADLIARIRVGRPDLVGDFWDKRLEDWRDWIRAKAPYSHNVEATFSGFMRNSHAAPEPSKKSRSERTTEILAELRKQRGEE